MVRGGEGRGRGWRRGEINDAAARLLTALRDGQERHSTVLAREAGLDQGNVINTLKRLERERLVSSRMEGIAEHQARVKEPGDRNKGPRRTYWKITTAGRRVVQG